MRPDAVVGLPPAFDEDLGLPKRVEDFSIQKFITQFAIEAFIVAVLPRAAWLDVERRHADASQPVADHLGGELRAVI